MREFVIEYWLEVLFGVLITVLGTWCKRLQKKLKQRQAEQDALKEGMKAILHDKLFQICSTYLSLGYIPADEAEEILDNAKIVYDAYHGIGGNGTGTTLYERLTSLPFRSPDTA